MPLTCIQTDKPIKVADGGFFVAGRFNDGVICPLSAAAIALIPEGLRRPKSCEALKDYLGVDISAGLGVPDGSGSGEFSPHHVSTGAFRFSVSRETMHHRLGEIAAQFPERSAPQKKAQVA